MSKKDQILLTGLISSILSGIISYYLFKKYNINVYYSGIPVILILLFSISLSTDKKYNSENYLKNNTKNGEESDSDSDDSSSNCKQTINIVQNCGKNNRRPGPTPPGPVPPKPPGPVPPKPPGPIVNKKDILNWIDSVNSKLTNECKNCILSSALKLWDYSSFENVSKMSKDEQSKVLYALLSFDCQKVCSIGPDMLNKKEVMMWVAKAYPGLNANCMECVITQILRLWNNEVFENAKNMKLAQQKNIIEGLLAMDCKGCKVNTGVDPNSVKKWLNSLSFGEDIDCMNCVVDKIVNLWDLSDYMKVVNLSNESQKQIVSSIMLLSCGKDCVNVPNRLNEDEVRMWVTGLISEESDKCLYCIVQNVMKLWNYAIFSKVMKMSRTEQQKILQGLILTNCDICINSGLTKNQILAWLRTLSPKEYKLDCLNCIALEGLKMWDKREFTNLLTKPTSDQIKILKAIADYNCPHACPNVPIEPCQYDY